MIPNVFVLLFLANLVLSKDCYWNDGCAYQLYSSKTPYDVVRGDIRDYAIPENCQAVSLWSLNRHGNRNPGNSVTTSIRAISTLKQEIVDSYYAGRGELCAQDIENFKKWKWNETLDTSQSYLTGTGYEELYDIGKRIREKYSHLLELVESENVADHFYFRTTNEQRTITSSMAFVHGLREDTKLNFTIDGPWTRDDIIRPYENCDKYQQEVKEGPLFEKQMDDYYKSPEFITVQQNVQKRLGISTDLSPDDVYSLYELCRFLRSWEPDLRSPWCAAFSHQDLIVLEYREDVKHYYRNGYGSKVNVNLGSLAVKDLFERFDAFVQGRAHRLVAYFTHDTMIEMTASAMGLFSDNEGVIQGAKRDPNRQWRSSYIGSFSSNILAILNSCKTETENNTYKVQLFYNEKVTNLCPLEGCSWQEFHDKFKSFTDANLQFCAVESRVTEDLNGSGSATGFARWMLMGIAALFSLI